MIKITIYKHSDIYKGFKLIGHAGYAEHGSDIVCAAVSALTINCINSIEEFTQDNFSVDEDANSGMIDFKFGTNISTESKLLMDSFVLGVKAILEDNKDYIYLEFKEV